MQLPSEQHTMQPSREAQQPIVIQPTPTVGQHIPSIPNIPTTIHHTTTENMEYWLEKSYRQYLDRQNISLAALGWSSKLQHRFCKRKDIALWVKAVAERTLSDEDNAFTINWETDGMILLRVASVLDEERGAKTVMNALHDFKCISNLSWIRKRSPKK